MITLAATPAVIEISAQANIVRSAESGSGIGAGFVGSYRFHPQLAVGIYTSPFFALREPSGCPDNASCSIAGGQAGVEGRYRFFAEERRVEPWIGVGLGIDVLQRKDSVTTRSSGVLFSSTSTISNEHFYYGPTALFIGGVDFRFTGAFTLGPFATFGVGKYLGEKTRTRVNSEETESSSGTADKAVHTWFFAGVRAMFEIHLRR
jgi:hypothetical protein